MNRGAAHGPIHEPSLERNDAMTIQTATPYLILHGKAREAIGFYQQALGARATDVQRFGDVDKSCSEANKDNIMHAALRVGEALLMMSDGPLGGPLPEGGLVSIALDFNDESEMRKSFTALGASGSVIEPIFAAPWGALFGVVRDRFGVSWMCNCAVQH
jgi:PhnB protein